MANGKPIIRVDEEKALESNRTIANNASKKSLHKSNSREEQESLDVDPSEIAEEMYTPNQKIWMDLESVLNHLIEINKEMYPPVHMMLREVDVDHQRFAIDSDDSYDSDDESINSFGLPELFGLPEIEMVFELESVSEFEFGEEYDSHESDDDAHKD